MKAVALQVFFKPIFLQGYDLTIFLIMWQLHVTTFIVAGKKEVTSHHIVPLEHGRTYSFGKGGSGNGARNDINIDTDKSGLSRYCGKIVVGEWPERRKEDRENWDLGPSTLHIENEALKSVGKGMPASTPRDKKQLKVYHLLEGRPKDSQNDLDYELILETGKFAIQDRTRVTLINTIEAQFVWVPIVCYSTDKRQDSVQLFTSLRRWGIWVDAQFRPKKTTHLILDGEIKDDDVNHSAVSCGIHIVSQAYLSDLAKLLQPFTQGNQIQTFSTNFNLPDPTEYLPEPNKEDFEDVRRNRNWWIAKPARAQVWAGKVVVFMSKKNFEVPEQRYMRYSGALVLAIDITTKPVMSPTDLQQRVELVVRKAQTGPDVVVVGAITDAALHMYDGINIAVGPDVLTLEAMGSECQNSTLWWKALTRCNWKDFVESDESQLDFGTQSGSFQPLAARETASHSSAGNSPTFIPSTHPGEEPELIHDVDMDGAHGNGEEKGKEADEPSQPPVRRPLKRRARKGADKDLDLFADFHEREESTAHKRIKLTDEKESMPDESASQRFSQSSSSNPTQTGLRLVRRRREKTADIFDEVFDTDMTQENADPLAKFRDTYNRVKQSGVPDAVAEADDDEIDFVQASIQRRREEIKTQPSQASVIRKRQSEAPTSASSLTPEVPSPPTSSQVIVMQPATSNIEVTQDTSFLNAIDRTQRQAQKDFATIDKDFEDMALGGIAKKKFGKANNSIVLSKLPTASSSKAATAANAAKIYATVEDMDPNDHGNFIVVEKKNLYRNDRGTKGVVASNSEWAHLPNFKKFKKQEIVRRQPIPLRLAPKADYGLGDDYWANGTEADIPTAASQITPPRRKNTSQAQVTEPSTSQCVNFGKGHVLTNKPKRKLLLADSDDEDLVGSIPGAIRYRSTSVTNSVDSNPSFTQGAKRGRKKRSPPVIDGPVDLSLGPNFDSDDGFGEKKRARRDNSIDTVSRSFTMSSGGLVGGSGMTKGTGRRRLLQVDEDDDDVPIFTETKQRR